MSLFSSLFGHSSEPSQLFNNAFKAATSSGAPKPEAQPPPSSLPLVKVKRKDADPEAHAAPASKNKQQKKAAEPPPAKHSSSVEKEVPQEKQELKRKEQAAPAQGGEDTADSSSDGEGGTARNEAKERKQVSPGEQAEQLQRTIFVGNVPAKMPLKALKSFFSKYGEVASARLRSVPVDLLSKMPKRAAIMKNKVDDSRAPAVAYVVFKEAASVEAALAANMTELGGNHLRVDRAAPPAKAASASQASHQFDTSRSLFVGNLHFATMDEELIQFFTCPEALQGNSELAPAANGGRPAVEGVRIVRDPATSLNKGFGFVLFRTKAAVRAALSLNGRLLRKRPLRLTRVSVQQQQTLQVQRAAAAAVPAKAGKGQQQQQQSNGKGKLHKTAGGGVSKTRGGLAAGGTDSALWQGTQIKGKAKGVRGTKAVHQQGRTGKQSGGAFGSTKRSGKRPAVAAKKKKQLASKAQQKHKKQ